MSITIYTQSNKATFTAWKRQREREKEREGKKEREICAAIPFLCFLLPSFPPLFHPSCLQSGWISPALIGSEHWACCWCAVHTPHRGRQIISQPLWAARHKAQPCYRKTHICPVISDAGRNAWMIRVCDRVVKARVCHCCLQNVCFRDLFRPHLEGLNQTFILPLLAVKLVLLRVISLSFCVCSSVCWNLYLACASMYVDAWFGFTLCWSLHGRKEAKNHRTEKAQKLTSFAKLSFQFWRLEQWCLHTSLTNITAAAGERRRGRREGGSIHVQFNSGTRAFSLPGCSALLLTQQAVSDSVTHTGGQTKRFYESPHHRVRTGKLLRNARTGCWSTCT